MKEIFSQLEGKKCPEKSQSFLEFVDSYFGGVNEFEEYVIKKMSDAKNEGIDIYSNEFEDIILEYCSEGMASNVENALRGNIRGIVKKVEEEKRFGKDRETEIIKESNDNITSEMIRDAEKREWKRTMDAKKTGIDLDIN